MGERVLVYVQYQRLSILAGLLLDNPQCERGGPSHDNTYYTERERGVGHMNQRKLGNAHHHWCTVVA